MAVKARDDVTLANITDVANVRRYYLLQSSTLAAPSAPTANPAPSPWVTSEPTYSEGSTNTLYTVDLTVFSDGTFDYSTVSKSSSYEAAKSAYNKAVAANSAAETAQSTANAKSKTFTTTPAPPYSVGDLWRNGNKVYICTTARTSGSYTASDWTLTADKTSENTAADTSKVGGTASATVIQNIATALANGKPFIQQATPSATAVGQLWFPTDSSGRVIGMKVSTATGTGSWQDYLMMAGQILVPGSVGTTEIGPEGVTAANIKASNELWAKIATFAKVTTDMLTAGNAVITGDLLADIVRGITLVGAMETAESGNRVAITSVQEDADGSSATMGMVSFYTGASSEAPAVLANRLVTTGNPSGSGSASRTQTMTLSGGRVNETNMDSAINEIQLSKAWSRSASGDIVQFTGLDIVTGVFRANSDVSIAGGVATISCGSVSEMKASTWPAVLRSSVYNFFGEIRAQVYNVDAPSESGLYRLVSVSANRWQYMQGDTGWVSLVASSYYTPNAAYDYPAAAVRLIDGIVHLMGGMKSAGAVQANSQLFNAIPEGFRPATKTIVLDNDRATTNGAESWVDSAGTLCWGPYRSESTTLIFSGSWPVQPI